MSQNELPDYKELYERAAGLLQTVLRGFQTGSLSGGTLIIRRDPFETKSVEQHILDTMGWVYAEPEPPMKDEEQARLPL